MEKPGERVYFEGRKWIWVFPQNVSWINKLKNDRFYRGIFENFQQTFLHLCFSQCQLRPASPGYRGAICPHCQSRALAKLFCPGVGHLPTQGDSRTFGTHVVSYLNITTQKILLEKQADWLICQGREKIVEGFKGMFSILCMHFFIAYQAGIL